MRTLPVGLTAFQGQFKVEWHLLMAGAVIAMIPVLIIYILAQKKFVEGMTFAGLAGR
jgi:multiple sugar transport system permease protein